MTAKNMQGAHEELLRANQTLLGPRGWPVWSISVNGNWRLTFAFENGDAILVDYQDYH